MSNNDFTLKLIIVILIRVTTMVTVLPSCPHHTFGASAHRDLAETGVKVPFNVFIKCRFFNVVYVRHNYSGTCNLRCVFGKHIKYDLL